MVRATFVLGIHDHQPVGNFDHVFEEAYEKAYAPFLAALERHPAVKTSIHTSGPLVEWLEERHPADPAAPARLAAPGPGEAGHDRPDGLTQPRSKTDHWTRWPSVSPTASPKRAPSATIVK